MLLKTKGQSSISFWDSTSCKQSAWDLLYLLLVWFTWAVLHLFYISLSTYYSTYYLSTLQHFVFSSTEINSWSIQLKTKSKYFDLATTRTDRQAARTTSRPRSCHATSPQMLEKKERKPQQKINVCQLHNMTTMWTGFRFCITVLISWVAVPAVEGAGLEARQCIVSCLSDPCQDQN